jgi:hypothetical protein
MNYPSKKKNMSFKDDSSKNSHAGNHRSNSIYGKKI